MPQIRQLGEATPEPQTETRLDLSPGKHTFQLVLGDAKHYPFNPPLVSEKITVTIK